MNKKINYQLFAIALLLFLISCADGRPEPTEAKKQFEQLYPGVQVMSIRMTEDEVMARSFEFLYRKPNVQTEKKIGIQFMKNQETRNTNWGQVLKYKFNYVRVATQWQDH